jgi:hypothetical protein
MPVRFDYEDESEWTHDGYEEVWEPPDDPDDDGHKPKSRTRRITR